MEWSDEMVLEFIRHYEAEPIIWDPKNVHNKKKHLVAEAWHRLQNQLSFSISIDELKKKKNSLMAYYRIHLKKIKNSRKSGMGTEDSYKTNWFAFASMHNFLAPIYECTTSIKTEESIDKASTSDESSSNSPIVYSTPIRKKRQQSMPDPLQAKKQMDEAFSLIKEKATNKVDRAHECDLFGQLLSEKLKKLDEHRRTILMNKIDNMVFKEIMSGKGKERADASSPNSPIIIHPSSPNP